MQWNNKPVVQTSKKQALTSYGLMLLIKILVEFYMQDNFHF